MSSVQSLEGLKVLEFSHTVMGPCAGLVLADLGAEVIKVEPAPFGDRTRQLPGFASGFFATFNRNKKSIAVDLKKPAGQALIHKLVKSTDIVIENYGPGTMQKLGCDWDTLKQHNKKLIYLSLKGYLKGPYENKPALDEVVQFQSGLAYMTGPVGQPIRAGASIVDILGAVFGVTGVLAALREREQTGKGQRVGSALFESAAFLMASHIAGGAALDETVPPMTARKGAWGVYDVFRSSDDQQFFLGVTSDTQWQSFCKAFNCDLWLNDSRLATNTKRCAERHWLIPQLTEYLSQRAFNEIENLCTDAAVSFSPVAQPEDLLTHPQLTEADSLIPTSLASALDAVMSETLLPGLPLEFGESRLRSTLHTQPPELGQHTIDTAKSIALSDKDIETLLLDKTLTAT